MSIFGTLRRIRHVLAQYASVCASKRSLARLLSTFICCLVVVIKPFSHLGGNYAFLVLSLKELVFSVQSSLAQQLELTILNIVGALLGIAVSTLAKYIASRYPEDSATSRATCAVFLVLISFFGESQLLASSRALISTSSRADKKSFASFAIVDSYILLRINLDPYE